MKVSRTSFIGCFWVVITSLFKIASGELLYRQGAQLSALWGPRGQDGAWEGGLEGRDMCIHIADSCAVWQKLTRQCKAIIPHLKNKKIASLFRFLFQTRNIIIKREWRWYQVKDGVSIVSFKTIDRKFSKCLVIKSLFSLSEVNIYLSKSDYTGGKIIHKT